MKRTTPPTVNLCAASRNRRDESMMRSVLLIRAFCAARCAARSRRTRCSGVSPGSRFEGLTEARAAAEEGVAACLAVAWGMVDVKRVASLTLLGPTRDAMACVCGGGRGGDGRPIGRRR